MAERYVVTVSKTLHQKVGEEADRYELSRKEYVQNALAYFVHRKINPATYEPGKEFDTVQVLKYSTEKIISLIAALEQNRLLEITEEIVRGRLLQETQLNLLIEKFIEPEHREQLQKEIIEYVENVIKNSKK